jgi:predicted aspartyl protease
MYRTLSREIGRYRADDPALLTTVINRVQATRTKTDQSCRADYGRVIRLVRSGTEKIENVNSESFACDMDGINENAEMMCR